jgi:hypothetical protein
MAKKKRTSSSQGKAVKKKGKLPKPATKKLRHKARTAKPSRKQTESTTPRMMQIRPAAVTAATVAAPTPLLEDVLNDQWLHTTTHVYIAPGDTLGALWGKYGAGDYAATGVQPLIKAIKSAYEISLPASSLPATLTFSQLQILVGHT